MEQFVLHLLHVAAWTFAIIFLFALIGFIATIRWIMNLLMRGERAVETGVTDVEHMLSRNK